MSGFKGRAPQKIAQGLQETENVANEMPAYRARTCTTGLTKANDNIEQRALTRELKKSEQKKPSKEARREPNTKAANKVYYSYDWKNAARVVAGTYGVIFVGTTFTCDLMFLKVCS